MGVEVSAKGKAYWEIKMVCPVECVIVFLYHSSNDCLQRQCIKLGWHMAVFI